jgi:hypothetical protein
MVFLNIPEMRMTENPKHNRYYLAFSSILIELFDILPGLKAEDSRIRLYNS